MIVTAHIPLLPLRIAVIEARVAWDDPVALGPPPGDAQVIGDCTPAAWSCGVRPGLRVGEALARCPGLDLVPPQPDAARAAGERVTVRLEDMGAAVQPNADGTWAFAADGLLRQTELQMLQEIRYQFNIDRLHAAAIERGARARHMVV